MIKYLLNPKKKTFLLIAIILQIGIINKLNAFSGGTYTINGSAAASATNYVSFTAFANDLKNTTRGDGGPAQYAVGGSGVQGPVIVNVAAGTYTEQFLLTQITGVSATNRVTINGNGATLQFTPTSTAAAAVIDMNGTDYFNINNLTVSNLNTTYGYPFWIRNAADNNIIKKCKLRCNNMDNSVSTPLTYSAYIWFNNGTTTVTSGNAGNNNLIDSNDLRSGNGTSHGPYYAMAAYGLTTPAQTNATCDNIISNNYVRDFYLYGVYFYYCYGTTFRNNTITNQGKTAAFTTKYGLYQYYGTGIVDNNRIFCLNGNTPQGSTIYPLYFYNGSSSITWTYANKITNNYIFDFSTTTMYNYAYWYIYTYNPNQTLDIEHNTVAFDYPSVVSNTGTNYNFYSNYARSFKNNILYNNLGGTGTKYLLYNGGSTAYPAYNWTAHQNNDFRFGPNAAGTMYFAYGPLNATSSSFGTINTFADMLTASFPTTNLSVEPVFLSVNPASFDLTPTSLEMGNKGVYISALPKDNSGATRNTTKPDIGALEYFADIELTNFNLTFPTPSCSGFTSSISGRVTNTSSNPIFNPIVSYSINNAPAVSYTISGTINAGKFVDFTFPTQQKFSKSGATNIVLFNNATGDVITNDSIKKSTTITPAPGGSVISFNSGASSTAAVFNVNGKPDVTFPSEKLVYDFTAPSGLGYTNADYGVKWIASQTAKTASGTVANAIISSNGAAPYTLTVNPTKAWEDSTIIISLRVLSLVSGCDTIYTRRVLIAPKAVADFKVPTPLCERSEIYFENKTTVTSGIVDYEWDFGDGTGIFTEQSPVHVYASYGSYTVTMKAKTSPYTFVTQKSVVVNVTEVPIAKIINSNKCQGQNIVLNNASTYAGSGAISYTWSFSDGSADIIKNTAVAVSKQFTNAGAYTVTLKATADGCTDVVNKIVYQFAKPVANFNKLVGSCLNDEFTFENKSTIASGVFGNAWNFDDNGNIASDLNPNYTFNTAGTKNVKLKVTSEFNCVDSVIIPITVKQTPTTNFSLPFACDRTPTTFTNLTNLNGEVLGSYTWNLGQGAPSNATSPIVNWSNLGPRTISLKTVLQNGCSSEMSKNINVGVQPTANFEFEAKCAGSSIPFTNLTTFPSGNISYSWDFGDNVSTTEAAPQHLYTTTSTQTYFVKLKASIQGGCSDSIVKNLTVLPLPSTCDFNITRNYNAGVRNYVFTPVGTSMANTSYTWVTGDGNKVTSNAAGSNYNYKGNLKYCVTMVAATADGCECSKTKCIDVTTSVDAINQNNFVIYPNPSNGIFNIKSAMESANVSVEVYNMLGEKVGNYTFETLNNASMDLTHLNTGMYVVKILDGNNTSTQKINIIK